TFEIVEQIFRVVRYARHARVCLANSHCQRLNTRGRAVREFAMKNLVMCFDSTTNRPGARDATNAETLFRLLASDDDRQVTWYDAGEAVLNSPRLLNPAARRWRESVAAAARESVIDAY